MPPGLKDENKLEAVVSYSDREPETTGGSRSAMIRFVEIATFPGVQQLFSIGKGITSGRFSC